MNFNMTKEQKRIAIAEWMGWKIEPAGVTPPNGRFQVRGFNHITEMFPNYPNDLNAMHEAWNKLTFEQDKVYCKTLHKLSCTDNHCKHPWDCSFTINATASQRSEALCRTLWPERF
jgi:hypothetical protein